MTRMILGAVALGALAAVGGCLSQSEPTYTTTAVTLHADGTQTVTQGKITLSEELRQNAARAAAMQSQYPGLGTAAEAIATDGSCGFSDLWLYDQINYTGNRICFIGAGVADLTQYVDTCTLYPHISCTTWQTTARSYLGGVDPGAFDATAPICGGTPVTPCTSFAAYVGANLNTCAGSRYLNLDGACTCPTGEVQCGSTCVNTSTDSSNCGSCGHACPSPETCSGGSCVCAAPNTMCGSTCLNTSTDPNNCGSCGHVCSVANGTAGCSGGSCTVASCNAGYANCDGNPANGCEVNTGTDASHCGSCSNTCASGQTCNAGACTCTSDAQCTGLGTEGKCCTSGGPNLGMCFPVDPNDACSCGSACYGVGPALHGPTTFQAMCNAPNDCWRSTTYQYTCSTSSYDIYTVEVGYCPTPGT